jgi:hypothetical protein
VSVEPDSVNADLTRVAGSGPFWLDRRYFDLHLTGASPFERFLLFAGELARALQVLRHFVHGRIKGRLGGVDPG